MQFEVVSRTHVGLKRKVNEDNYLVRPELGLFVIADGMGGHEAGEVASGLIVHSLETLAPVAPDQLLEGIIATLGKVNSELRSRAEGSGQVIGSTVAGLLIDHDRARCFWAGDSRAYRLRGSTLQQISRDHSLVQDLVDAGMLDAERAHDHPNANVITRAVGAADQLRVAVAEQEIGPGDLLCLFTDGVTRVIPDEELVAALGARAPLSEIADGLVWTVLGRGAPDNLTLILVRLLEDER